MTQVHQLFKDVDEFLVKVEGDRMVRKQKSAARQAKIVAADQAHTSAQGQIDHEIADLVGSLDSATLGYLATLVHS